MESTEEEKEQSEKQNQWALDSALMLAAMLNHIQDFNDYKHVPETGCFQEVHKESGLFTVYDRWALLDRTAQICMGLFKNGYLIRSEPFLETIKKAEGFISGFEDDPDQEGIPELLKELREIITKKGQ